MVDFLTECIIQWSQPTHYYHQEKYHHILSLNIINCQNKPTIWRGQASVYPIRDVERIRERSTENRWHWWRPISGAWTTTWRWWPTGNISMWWDPIRRPSNRLGGSRGWRTLVRPSQVWRWPTEEWWTASVAAGWVLWPSHWQPLPIRWTSHNTKSWLYKQTRLKILSATTALCVFLSAAAKHVKSQTWFLTLSSCYSSQMLQLLQNSKHYELIWNKLNQNKFHLT